MESFPVKEEQTEIKLSRWHRLWRQLTLLTGHTGKDKGEEGQGLVEYGLVLLLVAVVVIAILVLLGPQIGSLFSAVSKGLS